MSWTSSAPASARILPARRSGCRRGPEACEGEGYVMSGSARPEVTGFFDKRTFSIQYVVADPATRKCAIIDPVLDYDEKSGSIATRNADRILEFVAEQGLSVEWILDTHPHADHFSAAP